MDYSYHRFERNLLESAAVHDNDISDPSTIAPKALTLSLMEHQKIGLNWLINMEKDESKKGGILCDDMGLGKTIQGIALILARPYQNIGSNVDGPLKTRATLIVAPVAILKQWEEEVLSNTEPQLKVLVHHDRKRVETPEELLNYDVVITSYQTVRRELVGREVSTGKLARTIKEMEKLEEEKADDDSKALNSKPLANVIFHRIILDEAHTIKTYYTSTAKACFKLRSEFRWCFTATPLQNGIDDLQSLIHFLRIKPYDNRRLFGAQIGIPLRRSKKAEIEKNVIAEIHETVKSIALRRTKASKINNRPIMQLPRKAVHMVYAKFTEDEQLFYEYISKSTFIDIDRWESRQPGRGSLTIQMLVQHQLSLTLILRLRQACLHPALIAGVKSTKKTNTPHTLTFPGTFPPGVTCVDTHTENLLKDVAKRRFLCEVCEKLELVPQWLTVCDHMVCHSCFTQHINNLKQTPKTCPACKGSLIFAFVIPLDITIARYTHERYGPDKAKYTVLMKNPMSGKIKMMLNILAQAKSESNNTDKTIIFSQFTSFLDILQKPLKKSKYKFVRFDGQLKTKDREAVLNRFKTDPSVTILLASTMCASAGLNLIEANRVILMDVWWNPAVESQAVSRVYRIGQTKEVFIYRIIIRNTIEEDILDLQEKKERLIKRALNEDLKEFEQITSSFKDMKISEPHKNVLPQSSAAK